MSQGKISRPTRIDLVTAVSRLSRVVGERVTVLAEERVEVVRLRAATNWVSDAAG